MNRPRHDGLRPVRNGAIDTQRLLVVAFLLALWALAGCAGRPESSGELMESLAPSLTPAQAPTSTPIPATATAPKPTATFVPLITPSATPEGSLSRAIVPRIDIAVAKQMADAGEAVLVDVRSQATYEQAHIAGAISIPSDEILDRYRELPTNQLIVFY
ncbi:MAG: rhodanese-like domain-containing protein [Anaerolineae bacterium]